MSKAHCSIPCVTEKQNRKQGSARRPVGVFQLSKFHCADPNASTVKQLLALPSVPRYLQTSTRDNLNTHVIYKKQSDFPLATINSVLLSHPALGNPEVLSCSFIQSRA